MFDLSQLKTKPDSKYLSWIQCWIPGSPVASSSSLDFTGLPGSGTKIFYSFVSWLKKEGWEVTKIDEWIEVSPTHAQYYQLTQSQKGVLEDKIRVGLTQAAQILGEYEMLLHDLRKYKEIVDALEKKDEHRLRAIFVDQVDVYTGEGVSLRSIVARWPTIIYDFMKLGDEEDPDKIAKKLNVSKAEGVILATKNKLYKQWKEIFGKEVKERYQRISSLVTSRKKMVEEYRNWLKPYVARYKMLKLGSELPERRKKMAFSTFEVSGQATYTNGIKIWAWQTFKVFELGMVEMHKEYELIYPYDHIIRDALLFGKILKIKPLSDIYPFLLEKLPEKEAKELEVVKEKIVPVNDARVGDKIANEVVKDWLNGESGMEPDFHYYEFLEIDISRAGLKIPGGEVENITFEPKVYLVSQNVLLLKLVEMKCREMEFENYLDEIIGIKKEEEKHEGKDNKKKEKEPLKVFKDMVPRRGPYISQYEQIENHFFPQFIKDFDDVRGFILDKMGV